MKIGEWEMVDGAAHLVVPEPATLATEYLCGKWRETGGTRTINADGPNESGLPVPFRVPVCAKCVGIAERD